MKSSFDKQKEIEGMAKILQRVYNCYGEFNAVWFAEHLAENNIGKIPEGAVVLTGMETEQRFEDLMVAFDEMGFMPNTTHPFPEEYVETWKQRLIFVFGQLRKETAEKFAERLSEEDCSIPIKDDFIIITRKTIDEICKEFTGDKDEKG